MKPTLKLMLAAVAAIWLAGCANGKAPTAAQVKADEAKINAAITTFQNDEAAVNEALPAITGTGAALLQ